MSEIIGWFIVSFLFIFWIAEDEVLHIEESVQEGQAIYEEKMSSGASIAIHRNGMVTIADGGQEVNLIPDEAYSVLDALYRYSHILRGRQDTVPLPEPQEEQWQTMGTCHLDAAHTQRDVFKCDGCKRMCCQECLGDIVDYGVDADWLCVQCIAPKEPIMAHPF